MLEEARQEALATSSEAQRKLSAVRITIVSIIAFKEFVGANRQKEYRTPR